MIAYLLCSFLLLPAFYENPGWASRKSVTDLGEVILLPVAGVCFLSATR